ncbi:MAG: hypothetical protein ABSG67_18885 [Thermoguttaceae bacterium]|jgi:hypothetical protein
MRLLSCQILSIRGLIAAIVLSGLAGIVRADEAQTHDLHDALAAAVIPDWDDSVAQAGPSTKAPVVPPPTVNPKAPSKPKLPPPKPPVSPSAEAPSRPTEGQPPQPNPVSSIFGGNAPPAEHLAGTPNMFGDFFNNVGGSVSVASGFADLPLAAASRRVKIAEDDNALIQDRVFFLYNHFEDALQMGTSTLFPVTRTERSFSVDRYTFGLEKSLNCCWSIELRMPLAGQTEFQTPDFGISGGSTGNLAVIVKREIYESDDTTVAVGLGIDTPTGSNVEGYASIISPKTNYFTVHNDAVHLLPFIGFVSAPNHRFFYQGFAQVDIPTNGNRIDYINAFGTTIVNSGTYGILNEQNLMYLDLSGGCWLYRNPCACGLTGLAALLEFHYTTTLQNTDVVEQTAYPPPFLITFENFANRVDIVNLTVGLHAEFANRTLCRVGGVFPLCSGDNRSFNSEVQVQVERRF